MAVQDELVPGTYAWARLGKKGRAKESARLGKSLAADRRKNAERRVQSVKGGRAR